MIQKQQLLTRIEQLRTEFDVGQKALTELDTKQANLRSTLRRISGAIQVLEEECAQPGDESKNAGRVEAVSHA